MKNSKEEKLLEFGTKRENEQRRDGGFAVVFDPETKLYAVGRKIDDGFCIFFAGGVEDREDIKNGTLREVVEESGLNDFLYVEKLGEAWVHYYHTIKKVNRVAKATGFLVVLNSKNLVETQLEAHENFDLTWMTQREILENWEKTRTKDNQPEHWIYYLDKAEQRLIELGYFTP